MIKLKLDYIGFLFSVSEKTSKTIDKNLLKLDFNYNIVCGTAHTACAVIIC